jgi:putative tryptophan/tyrosine transport system substrate-binding protein
MQIDRLKRREFITLVGGIVTAPLTARAESQRLQVGFLYPGPEPAAKPRLAAFISGLEATGLRVPDQLILVPRVTGGDPDKLGPMATELVEQRVDLIMAVGPAAIRAAKAATATIPIVGDDLESDPVAAGFVASVAHPGGNLTGVFMDFPDFTKKWLGALKEAVPNMTKIGIFWDPAIGQFQLGAIKEVADVFHIQIELFELRSRADAEAAFSATGKRDTDAIIILSSPFVGANTKLLADSALAQRLPAITMFPDFARNGGLMAYGPNLLAFFHQAGLMGGRILKGAHPSNLPVETPTKFEFVLNLRTAQQLGIKIPTSLLLRADETIE